MPSPLSEPASHTETEPVICRPFKGSEARLRDMERDLSRFAHLDHRLHAVWPDEAARNAEVAVRMRLSVLLRTYQGAYHTDSFEIERLVRQILAGEEHVWFWGGEEEIARFRKVLADPPEGEVPALALGTSTLLSVAAEYGEGYAEACRNGSMDTSLGAKFPYVLGTYDYCSNPDNAARRRYHTQLGACRNRASTEQVRGGEAMRRLAMHYLHYRFWGYLPFYVMQEGFLEQTELVECNRDPMDVLRALRKSPPWYIRKPEEASFAAALSEVSFGVTPDVEGSCRITGGNAGDQRYRLLLPPNEDLLPTNHVVVRQVPAADRVSGGSPLNDAVRQAVNSGTCCAAVQVDITTPDALDTQDRLADWGFVLSAVIPPKETWFEKNGVRHDVDTRATGIWVKPRPDLPVEPPFYRDSPGTTKAEQRILDYLRSVLTPVAASPSARNRDNA
jgi:hypothetical protein